MLAGRNHPVASSRGGLKVTVLRGFAGKPRPVSVQSDPGPHPWGLQPPARLLGSALTSSGPTVVSAYTALVLTEWKGVVWVLSQRCSRALVCASNAFLSCSPLLKGYWPPGIARLASRLEKAPGLLGWVPPQPGSGPTPARNAYDPVPFRPARLAPELLISSSGKPSLSADVIPVLGVIRARHVCRSATCHAPIRHSICSSLEGEINLDVADLVPQVTCLQL